MPKKAFQVPLSIAERTRLQALVTNGSATAHTHIHARILLKADADEQKKGILEGEALQTSQLRNS